LKPTDYNRYLKEEEYHDKDIDALLQYDASPPSTGLLKNFFTWYYLGSKGRITSNGKASDTSMDNQIKNFSMGLFRRTGCKIPADTKFDILEHLRQKGMEDAKKQKGSADTGVLQTVIKHSYQTGKIFWKPTGFPFAFKLLYYTCCRPGSILVDSVYAEGLCYKVRLTI
jgi:hypothetical protein